MTIILCVRTGNKYPVEYVYRLNAMLERHGAIYDGSRFICITDNPKALPGIETVWVDGTVLPGWWAKMLVFNHEAYGWGHRVYYDLDTVICGGQLPLLNWVGDFGICQNFTRKAGHPTWPCNYGSCVMSIGPGWGQHVWHIFDKGRSQIMANNPKGDQQAIEGLAPGATYLQDVLPENYFLHYRGIGDCKPDGCAIVVFGGRHTPRNNPVKWVQDEWRE